MGEWQRPISPQALYRGIGTAAAPVVIDLRSADAFATDEAMIVGAIRRAPEQVEQWRGALPADRPVVAYDARGGEAGAGVARALAAAGIDARTLDGGIAAWRALGLPTRRRLGAETASWVTRERPKVDRIACPWLIRRFIDPEARFLYVPPAEVAATAARTGATPYDIAGAEFGHVGERCSFDAFIRIFAIADKALDRLALIVRGADTGKPELTTESPLLLAVSRHLSERFADDHAMLEHGVIVYDALYAWCRLEVGHDH